MDCVPCQEGFDTRIILRPNTVTELKIFLGVLMEDTGQGLREGQAQWHHRQQDSGQAGDDHLSRIF